MERKDYKNAFSLFVASNTNSKELDGWKDGEDDEMEELMELNLDHAIMIAGSAEGGNYDLEPISMSLGMFDKSCEIIEENSTVQETGTEKITMSQSLAGQISD
ncbi:hypothetical protein C0995_011408 [Termitomyces sp. Mi166|nr:hypothetical protein C0995_011408 [Termitomyces sp. Mi166\